jgi:hypothetical protein
MTRQDLNCNLMARSRHGRFKVTQPEPILNNGLPPVKSGRVTNIFGGNSFQAIGPCFWEKIIDQHMETLVTLVYKQDALRTRQMVASSQDSKKNLCLR